MRRQKFNCSWLKLRPKNDTFICQFGTKLFRIRHIDSCHLIRARSSRLSSLDNDADIESRMDSTKFILRASLFSLVALVAAAFVMVRRDSIGSSEPSVSDQTHSRPLLLRNSRDHTQSPSTSNSY